MKCPQCNDDLGDIIEHVKKCSIDPQRLLAVGLLSVEEYNRINNIEGVVEPTPPTKHNNL
tara:strand:+ start:42 stop:221 length:180 start_codon:yes stop_codon:yes gene_type:complete